jgi:CDP-diacylglycerol--serine O-phosphatidyltransferase
MLGFALILIHPPIMLFLGFFIYAASGPAWTLMRLRERRASRRARTGDGGPGKVR